MPWTLRLRRLAPLAVAPCLLAACDAGDDGSGDGCGGGTVTATVDGRSFAGTCVAAAATVDGVAFAADDRPDQTSVFPVRELAAEFPAAAGTYALGGSSLGNATFTIRYPDGSPNRSFLADSGRVVVQSVSGRRYRGTFEFFTGRRSADPHRVTAGQFDVTVD